MLTPNEGRGVIGLPKSDQPEMDEFYLPTNNLSPIGAPPKPSTVIVPFGQPPPPSAPGQEGPPQDFPEQEPQPPPQRGQNGHKKVFRSDGTILTV
jgi:hypothetical protein